MELYKVFNDMMETIKTKVKKDEVFCAKDLFCGLEYNRFNKGEKVFLGTLLSYEAKSSDLIEYEGKNRQNHYVYRKKV